MAVVCVCVRLVTFEVPGVSPGLRDTVSVMQKADTGGSGTEQSCSCKVHTRGGALTISKQRPVSSVANTLDTNQQISQTAVTEALNLASVLFRCVHSGCELVCAICTRCVHLFPPQRSLRALTLVCICLALCEMNISC